MFEVDFQENASKESQNIEDCYCFSCKVSFITGWSQSSLHLM